MRLERLKSFALGLPATTLTRQWGDVLVFKVGGKMFLLIALDAETIERVSFKCSPAEFARLTEEVDGFAPAPYLARASWVALEDLAVIPEPELHDRIRASYDLVRAALPRKLRESLRH